MNSETPSSSEVPASPGPNKNLYFGFALAAAGILFAPFLIDAIHAGPASDDFCYAAQYDKSGFLGAIEHYYNNVNGRFFATFVIFALGTVFPIEHAYLAMPLIFFASIALAFVALTWALASTLAPRSLDWQGKSALGLLSALVLISNTRNISEVFFWLPASATFISAAAGTLLAVACMLALTRPNTGHSSQLPLTALGAVAAVAAVGSFETSGPAIMLSGAFGILVARVLGRPGAAGIAVIAIAAALGLWFNLSSPGTATRAQVIGLDAGRDLTGIVVIVARTFFWTLERLILWGSHASVWFLAFVFFWVFRENYTLDWTKDSRQRRGALTVLAGLILLPFLAALPTFYAYISGGPTRAQVFVDLFCLIFWLTALPFTYAAFGKVLTFNLSGVNRRRFSAGLFAACFLTIAGTTNYYQASVDTLRGIPFARQVAAQMRDVLDNPNRASEIVLTRSITAYAPTLFVSDINADPRRWRNLCFAEYLGAYGVKVEPIGDYKPKPKDWRPIMPKGWVDPDPQAIGRPRPVWPPE